MFNKPLRWVCRLLGYTATHKLKALWCRITRHSNRVADEPYLSILRRHRENAKCVLLVSHDLSLSGAPVLLYFAARELKQKGYFVMVASPQDGKLKEKYEELDIPVMTHPAISHPSLIENSVLLAGFDLTFVNTIVMSHFVHFSKRNKTPVAWLIHEGQIGYELTMKNRRVKEAVLSADRVLFYHKKTARLYRELSPDNIQVIRIGAESIEPQETTQESDKLRIVHIGSVEARKGQDILIDSYLALDPDVQRGLEIYFVGRCLEMDYFETEKVRTSCHSNIHWVGEMPRESVGDYLNRSDIYVCSSRDETGPLTVLEAMSGKKAVIASDVGEVSSMIENGEHGIVTPVGDAGALRDAIELLYRDRRKMVEFGEKAQKRFMDEYTVDHFTSDVVEVVDGMIRRLPRLSFSR